MKKVLIALLLLLNVNAFCSAEEVIWEHTFGVNDEPSDLTAEGRWSKVAKEQDKVFRSILKAKNCYYSVPCFWDKNNFHPAGDVAVVIDYKDVSTVPSTFLSYSVTGDTWGYSYTGEFGGKNSGEWARGVFIVKASNIAVNDKGQYAIYLRNDGSDVPVNRVSILKLTPELKNEALISWKEMLKESLDKLKGEFNEDAYEDINTLEGVSDKAKKQGYVTYIKSYTEVVYPGTIPTVKEMVNKIRLSAALGESEPASFVLYALKDLKNVNIRLSDLKGKNSQLLSSSIVEIKNVEYAPLRFGGGSGIKSWRMQPARLWEHTPLDITGKNSQQFWLTVNVPKDALPGEYEATISIKPENGEEDTIALTLQVLPFGLSTLEGKVTLGAYISKTLTDTEIKDQVAYGLNATSMWYDGSNPRILNVNGKLELDTRVIDEYFPRLKKNGMNGPVVIFFGNDKNWTYDKQIEKVFNVKAQTPEYDKYYVEGLKKIVAHCKSKGYNEIVISPMDEPSKGGEVEVRWKYNAALIKKFLPASRIFCVFMNRTDAPQKFRKLANIWSCNGAFKEAAAARNLEFPKPDIWTYGSFTARVSPQDTRFNAGFLPWKFNAEGTYLWAYKWYCGNPWNDLDSDASDWELVYPSPEGKLISTLAWEGVREGIDDRKYIATLEELISKNRNNPAALKIEKELIKLKEDISLGQDLGKATEGVDYFFFSLENTNILDLNRVKIIKWILELIEKK